MTLTVRLDDQEESRLQQIVEAMNAGSQSEAIRKMIEEKWTALQADQTFVERRGGHPENLLSGATDSSERQNRKKQLAKHFEERSAKRKRSR